MRKLILVALAAMALSSGAWAVCETQRFNYARCLKYHAEQPNNDCRGIGGVSATLQELRMALEACLVENGRYQ